MIRHLWIACVFYIVFMTQQCLAYSASMEKLVQDLPRYEQDIENFYKDNKYHFILLGASPKNYVRRRAIFNALGNADQHGLPVARYNSDALRKKQRAAKTEDELAQVELDILRAFIRYARDIYAGVLKPQLVDEEIAYPRQSISIATVMRGITENNPSKFIKAIVPNHPDYALLLQQKEQLENIIAKQPELLELKIIKSSERSEQVRLLRRHLQINGYGQLGGSTAFDEKLISAVKRFQSDNGLGVDGIAGRKTLRALNALPHRRLRAVIVNLERQRWLNNKRGDTHLWMNIPEFTLRLIENKKTIFESRTVVGKTEDDFRTIEFIDEMDHMVINPTWYVPATIAGSEYLPLLKQDANFLDNNNMKLFDKLGTQVELNSINLDRIDPENFPYFLRQQPDPDNALGQVKFMFPNRYNIYMHDTPSKNLFSRSSRAFSHGCVRVHKPFEFAYTLLRRQRGDAKAYFDRILETKKEAYVTLKKPIPVVIAYQSVVFEKNTPRYLRDIYGRDKKIAQALTQAGVAI